MTTVSSHGFMTVTFSNCIHRNTKIWKYKAIISSVPSYAHETWTMFQYT